ncbi:uncharacterized protein LAESUDRAFT_744060 [Laetiporus sulphureus 93-53]|uniref:Uncharacterized protein n=1 Tax=Laetiporus sulphureus 93-53 TaxID=1314785 RepID=A0A165DKX1_9APHY|nr:uncharacterized protein LAESUDRAFT_744060 [Laetiporus sulphureus 93-53]KZT05107.1 hypothetical protein LAESUDRAFT_744060 [Laetiporus sulphureus 93-53]
MPAPSALHHEGTTSPIVGHVNLMVDTFIANANAEDLRAIIRGTLGASPPSVASALTAAARRRMLQTNATAMPFPDRLFIKDESGSSRPGPALRETLSRVCALYGAGLGFASLSVLSVVVRATMGLEWEEGGELENVLASIDTDISQAIQSSREELESGRVRDLETARNAVNRLRSAVRDCREVVNKGIGGYPFEQGATALDFWKI